MMSEVEVENPRSLLDLGGGRGSLLTAASLRWSGISLAAVDIDQNNVDYINSAFSNVSAARLDVISRNFEKDLGIAFERSISDFDLLVGNPPYCKFKWKKHFFKILEESEILDSVKGFDNVEASIIFLSRYLNRRSPNSHISIIFPDSIVSSEKYRSLRKVFVEKHNLYKIVSLPRRVFKGTDVKTHILYFSGSPLPKHVISICKLTEDLKIQRMEINAKNLPPRLDYDYISYNDSSDRNLQIGDTCSVSRGSTNYSEAKHLGIEIFHTNGFHGKEKYIDFPHRTREESRKRFIAIPGDIIIGRVGRNILDQRLIVRSGNMEVSDCVIIIRPAETQATERIFSELSSERGRAWLLSRMKGTGAKTISISDIKKFPL